MPVTHDQRDPRAGSAEAGGDGPPDPWRADRQVRTRRLALESGLVGLGSLVAGCLSLQVWRGSLRVPFHGDGDGAFYLMLIRGLERNGQYLSNPGLGYPHGQELHDLPHGADNLNLLLLRLAALVGEPGLALNLFYLGTFALVGATMHVLLRRLGARAGVAAVVSVLFAVAPFHLLRGTAHVLLSAYYSVPIGVLLALAVLSDDPPFTPWRRWRPTLGRREAWVALGCVVLASAGAYYAFFSLVLLGAGAAAAALARGTWRPIASAAVHLSLIAAVFVANLLPSVLYWAREGSNPRVARRYPSETELYGLRISQLVVPRPDHRLGPLSRMAADSRGGPIDSELGQNLGLVAGAGLVMLLGLVAWRLVDRAPASAWWSRGRGRLLLDTGFLTVCCLLTAAAGGFSYLLSAMGARDIRAWNRMSIVVAALACVAVALLVSEGLDRRRGPGARRWGGLALGTLLVVGLLDQTSPADARGRPLDDVAWTTQRDFYRETADRLPDGAPVFQLPVMEFPEVPPTLGTDAYAHALAYVHAPELRWSFGGMKGRVPDPVPGFDARPGDEISEALTADGYQAVVVDRAGYADAAADLEARLSSALGPAVEVSADERYALFLLD